MRPWQEIAQEAQQLRDNSIPPEWILKNKPSDDVTNVMSVPYECGLLSQQELAWTDMDATSLLELLACGKLKSYDLTSAFCKRAAIAHQLLNCMTEMWFAEALDRAKELDEIFAISGPVGPYHGLPFSVKNSFNVKGKRSSGGYVLWYENIAEQDAPLVKIIRDAGAVFYCKTNNPQTVMHLETQSNLYGRTVNPYNRNLTPGGSSGGESALISFGGSPIGLAADGGGSIRSPAANTGLFGLKATSNRVPIFRSSASMRGTQSFPVVAGPLSRTARDIEYFMQVVHNAEIWRTQPYIVLIPWRSAKGTLPRKIVIGVYSDDGEVRPHPPILDALKQTTQTLKADPRFEVIEWQPFKHALGYDILRKLYWEDGGVETRAIMTDSGEPLLPLTEWVMKDSHVQPRSLKDSWELNYARETFQADYLNHWLSAPIVPDFIIGPVGPSVAPLHDTARYWGYTAIFNILDYPSCAFPTGLVSSAESHPTDSTYIPRENEFDAYNWRNYDPQGCAGAPISLQVTGRKWDCEKVLEVARLVSEALGVDHGVGIQRYGPGRVRPSDGSAEDGFLGKI